MPAFLSPLAPVSALQFGQQGSNGNDYWLTFRVGLMLDYICILAGLTSRLLVQGANLHSTQLKSSWSDIPDMLDVKEASLDLAGMEDDLGLGASMFYAMVAKMPHLRSLTIECCGTSLVRSREYAAAFIADTFPFSLERLDIRRPQLLPNVAAARFIAASQNTLTSLALVIFNIDDGDALIDSIRGATNLRRFTLGLHVQSDVTWREFWTENLGVALSSCWKLEAIGLDMYPYTGQVMAANVLGKLAKPLQSLTVANVRKYGWLVDGIQRARTPQRGGLGSLRALHRLEVIIHHNNGLPPGVEPSLKTIAKEHRLRLGIVYTHPAAR